MFAHKQLAYVAAIVCFAATGMAAADNQVLYEATGTFATPPISGSDLFKLQGEPFTISITAKSNAKPKHHGPEWAVYTPVTMMSTVYSGLLNVPTPVNSSSVSIELQKHTANDLFEFATPFKLVGLQLTIGATVTLPAGTLTTLYVHPFNGEVTLDSTNATLTYSDSTGTTTLGIMGTLKTIVKKKK